MKLVCEHIISRTTVVSMLYLYHLVNILRICTGFWMKSVCVSICKKQEMPAREYAVKFSLFSALI